ncbi:MAG TPA: hypothetical protein VI113_06420 [Alphaproteobacteria bacterium]
MSRVEELQLQLDGVVATVDAARRVLADGRAVDLMGLEARVAALCDTIGAQPERVASHYRPRLIALLDEVDRLRSDLEVQRAILARELGTLAARRQAIGAYAKKYLGK